MSDGQSSDAAIARSVDARGLRCPLPVLLARRALAQVPPGALVEVLTDDPATGIDMPHLCAQDGHEIARRDNAGGHTAWLIRRANRPA